MSRSPTNFLAVFSTRREYCRALLAMARRQVELVEDGDYAGLLELLARKQRLLGRLDQLSQSHPDLWQQWREWRDRLAESEREACERALQESEELLAEALAEERTGADLLAARRDETQRQLEAVTQGLRASQAYRPDLGASSHRHLDVNQ